MLPLAQEGTLTYANRKRVFLKSPEFVPVELKGSVDEMHQTPDSFVEASLHQKYGGALRLERTN
jgi:hypothetical protein